MCGFAFEYEEPIYEESKIDVSKIIFPQKQEEEKKISINRNKEKKESADFNLQDLIQPKYMDVIPESESKQPESEQPTFVPYEDKNYNLRR